MKVTELNEERKRQGLSVAELAQRSNLPKGTVEKVLFGIVQNPRIDTMQAIEKALGISEGKWTDADRAGGISERGKITVNADEMEMLDLYNSIGHKFGKTRQETIKKLLEAMLEEEKK